MELDRPEVPREVKRQTDYGERFQEMESEYLGPFSLSASSSLSEKFMAIVVNMGLHETSVYAIIMVA